MKLIMYVLSSLYLAFKEPIVKLYHVYSNLSCFAVGAGIASFWAWFKIAFERDHVVSFDIVVNIALFLVIDTILGVWKHIKKGTVSSEGWGKFITKFIIYFLLIKVVDKIATIKLLGWSGDLFLSGILIHEAISIIENMGAIYPGVIPPWILKKLKDFDDDGEVNNSSTDPK